MNVEICMETAESWPEPLIDSAVDINNSNNYGNGTTIEKAVANLKNKAA